jgi:hypothetical protein
MGNYGAITQLAQTYKVSRTFIYSLINNTIMALYLQFYSNFLPHRSSSLDKLLINKIILLHRLEGNSSIERISNMLHYNNISPSSVGYISNCLTYYGKGVSNTLEINSSQPILLAWLNDELFAHKNPILVTMEPKSLAILRMQQADKRDSTTWYNHFNQITQHNFYPTNLCSDRGDGIVKASEETFNKVNFQPDIFHDIQGLFKVINVNLQRNAYKAINHEYKCQRVLSSAVSMQVKAKRSISYDEAKEEACEAVELYDQAHYLFGEIRQLLEFIDENGNFRHRESVKQNILTATELLKSLGHAELLEAAYTFDSKLDELLLYMHTAQQTHKHLSEKITDKELLSALCLAWRCDHKIYQNPTPIQKRYLQDMRDFTLEYSQVLADQNYNDLKEYVFCCLDNIIRASSLVETVNSLIRPYLNTCKGQITQEMLNLITPRSLYKF